MEDRSSQDALVREFWEYLLHICPASLVGVLNFEEKRIRTAAFWIRG